MLSYHYVINDFILFLILFNSPTLSMRQILLSLSFSFLFVCAGHAQTLSSPHTSVVFRHHTPLYADGNMASATGFAAHNYGRIEYASPGGEDPHYVTGSGRYTEALHKRNAGIGLTAAGGTCLIGGIALLAVGSSNVVANVNNSNDMGFISNIVEIAFGTILTLAGTGMTIPGGILLGRGVHDLRKAKTAQANQ
jgi:hypothetical protein